jgi:hypothetical protein
VNFGERVLKFKYPEKLTDVTKSTFLKKFVVDYFLLDLLLIGALIYLIRPHDSEENFVAFVKIELFSVVCAFVFDLLKAFLAKAWLRRKN